MNKLGISTSCYYPQPTEKAFAKICASGVRASEVFFNSPAELESGFISSMKQVKADSGMDVISVHTFTGFMDSFFLFTDYERRFYDGLDIYKRLGHTAAELGASYVVMHGAKSYHTVGDEELKRRFSILADAVFSEGAMLCYENVNKQYRSCDPGFLKMMLDAASGKAGAVLDVKQARRAELPFSDFIDTLGSYIKHVHISDFNEDSDCITPLTGYFDFGSLFSAMDNIGYNGAYIIELYQHSYKSEADITKSYNLLIEKYNNLC